VVGCHVVGLPVLVGLSVVSSLLLWVGADVGAGELLLEEQPPPGHTGPPCVSLLLSLVGARVGGASVGALVGVGGTSVGALTGALVGAVTGVLVGAATGVLVGALVGVSGESLSEVLLLLESLMLLVLLLVSFSGSEALVGASVTGRCVGCFVGAWVGGLVLALQ